MDERPQQGNDGGAHLEAGYHPLIRIGLCPRIRLRCGAVPEGYRCRLAWVDEPGLGDSGWVRCARLASYHSRATQPSRNTNFLLLHTYLMPSSSMETNRQM